jgi:hypothetical protein
VNHIATIAVKPWVKKFLTKQYGNPHCLDLRDPLSAVLFANLRSKRQAQGLKDNGAHIYKVRIAARHTNNHGFVEIAEQNKHAINRYFEDLFYRQLHCFVAGQRQIKEKLKDTAPEISKNITIKKAIEEFLDIYRIDENEYPLHSVERQYRLYSKKMPTFANT